VFFLSSTPLSFRESGYSLTHRMAFTERPDLEPHRYFHEVFRLAALVYLHMLLELPPTSYPILLLVRKMLSLVRLRFRFRSLEAMVSGHSLGLFF
jgi:hypothetical protein